jgi:hypothetical protein
LRALKKGSKPDSVPKEASDRPEKKRSQAVRERDGLPDRYALGHCTMCELRWGRFDQPEDTVRIIRELQDIQKWLFYMRKYTNMTTPNGEDPED